MKWMMPTKIVEVHPEAQEPGVEVADPEFNVPVLAWFFNPNTGTGKYAVAVYHNLPRGKRWMSEGRITYAPLLWQSISLPEKAKKGYGLKNG